MIVVSLGLTAFVLCLVGTPLIRNYFIRMGKVDHPDDDRKFHKQAVPRSGGIGIVLSYFAAIGIVYLLKSHGGPFFVNHRTLFIAVLPATAIMFLVGLADDLYDLSPKIKLAGQFVAAVVAVSLGVRLNLVHGPSWIGIVLSVVWLLACTNAVNLIDGMDGLATGVGLTATLTTLLVAVLSGNVGLALATAPLAGALFAFLRYNFSPASVFLGDSGSLTIGFLLGCLGLVWDSRAGMLGMVGPLMTMALPLADVSLSIGRRFLRRRPIFKGDRGHIHHRVLALGFTPRGAALVLYSCCFLSASLALVQTFGRREMGIGILLLFVILLLFGIKRLGYVEFHAARKTLSHRKIRRAVQEEIYIEELRRALLEAQTPDECWLVLQRTCDDLSIEGANLQLGTANYIREAMLASGDEACCQLRIVLAEDTWLLLTGSTSTETSMLATAVHHIQAAVRQRLVLLETTMPLTESQSLTLKKAA